MKEIDWPAPCGYTVFCDDIRGEVGGKHSLIGTYNGNLLINGDFPVLMPKLGFFVVYTERLDADIPDTVLKIIFPGDEEDSPRVSIPMSPPSVEDRPEPIGDTGPDPRLVAMIPLVFPNVLLKEKGRIKVRMYRGDEIIKLGALTVDVNPEHVPDSNRDTAPSE